MSAARVDLEVRANANQAREVLKGLERQLADLPGQFAAGLGMGLGQGAFATLVSGLKQAAIGGLEYNASIEKQTVSFKVLLGSMAAAQERMKDLARFAATTPFELPEVVNASRLLQSLTGGDLASGAALRMIGDAAAAAGRSFEETAMWVGRLYVGLKTGTPVGEATLRLLEMGLISGETARRMNELAVAGVSSEQAMGLLRETFQVANGAMEEQSRTLEGLNSTWNDTWKAFTAAATAPWVEPLKQGLKTITVQFEALNRVASAFPNLAAWSVGMGPVNKGLLGWAGMKSLQYEQIANAIAADSPSPGGPAERSDADLLARWMAIQQPRFDSTDILGPGNASGAAEAERQRTLAAKQEQLDLTSEDAFWQEQMIRDYEAQNRLVEQQNEAKERSLEMAIEESRRRQEQDYRNSYVGGTRERFDDWQRASAYDGDVGEGMIAGWQNALMQLGTVAQNAGMMIQNVVGGAISNVSAGITGLILGTTTWGNVLRQIGTSILQSVIDGVVRMFTAWIAKRLAVSAVEKSAAAGEAAAKAPVALMDSISSWGIAAGVGLAAFLVAMAATGGFQEGGYTGAGPDGEVAGVVHRGEFVVPASAVRSIGVDRLEAMAASPAAASAGAPGAAAGRGSVRVINYIDRREFLDAMRDDIEAIASDALRRMA